MAFDRDEVIEQVVDLFWRLGYQSTGMSDIVEATGLNKSSIYNTFGSKESLFREALEAYTTRMISGMLEILAKGEAGLDDLHRLVDLQFERVSDGDAAIRGCLAVNSGTELGHTNPEVSEHARSFRSRLRGGFVSALERAVELGEIDRDRVDSSAELFLGLMLATTMLGRSGASQTELQTYVVAQHDFVEGLRKRQQS